MEVLTVDTDSSVSYDFYDEEGNVTKGKSPQNCALYFRGYTYDEAVKSIKQDKNDLVITLNAIDSSWNNYEIRLNNYFLNKDNKNFFRYILTDEDNTKMFKTDIIEACLIEHSPTKITGANVIGTLFDDEITGTEGADKIVSNSGKDVIYGTKGNDKITAGTGADTIVYNSEFDTDTVILTKNENLIIDFSGLEINSDEIEYTVKKDVTVKTAKGTVILKGYGKQNVSTLSENVIIKTADKDINLSEDIFLPEYNSFSKKKLKYSGTRFGDKIDASSLDNLIINNKKGAVISSGSGDDEITGSKYDDTFAGGEGRNTIFFKKGFGNDTVKLSKNEDLTLDLSALGLNPDELSYSFKKKDLNISTGEGSVTIKNFGSKDISERVVLKLSETQTIDLKEKFYSYDKFTSKNKKYTGNLRNEIIDGSSINDVLIKNNKGVTVNGGAGDDTIFASKYNDTITGGVGTNKIIYSAGGGEDKIYLSKGETLTVYYDDKNAVSEYGNEFVVSRVKNNVVITRKGFEDKITLVNVFSKNLAESIKFVTRWGEDLTEQYVFDISNNTVSDGTKTDYIFSINEASVNSKRVLSGTVSSDNINIKNYKNDKNFGVTIKSGLGNDVITGSIYDDKIYTGAGKDTVKYLSGSGCDTLYDMTSDDVLSFEDTRFDDLVFIKDKNNLEIVISENEKVIISNYFVSGDKPDKLFALNGENINEYSISTDAEMTVSGEGIIRGTNIGNIITNSAGHNDEIYAGLDKNTLIFNSGDGVDTVYSDGGTDTLKFNDTLLEEMSFEKDGYDLLITYTSDGDKVRVKDYFNRIIKNDDYESVHSVKYITDKDGVTVNLYERGNINNLPMIAYTDSDGNAVYETIDNKDRKLYSVDESANYYYGTSDADEITFEENDGYIYANGGSDTVYCGAGNNIIRPGTGDDVIYGESANSKIYLYDGDGHDTLYHGSGSENLILYANYDFDKSGNDLIISNTDNDDSVTIKEYYNLDQTEREHIKINSVESTKRIIYWTDCVIEYEYKGEPFYIVGTAYEGNDNGNYIYTTKIPSYVESKGGNDKIYLQSELAIVEDSSGNDEYIVKSILDNTFITDNGGNDVLNILESYSDMLIIFDTGSFFKYTDLILVSKDSLDDIVSERDIDNTSGIRIHKFRYIENNVIERINTTDGYITTSDIAEINSDVSGWLEDNNYINMSDVMNKASDEELKAYIGLYQSHWHQNEG